MPARTTDLRVVYRIYDPPTEEQRKFQRKVETAKRADKGYPLPWLPWELIGLGISMIVWLGAALFILLYNG